MPRAAATPPSEVEETAASYQQSFLPGGAAAGNLTSRRLVVAVAPRPCVTAKPDATHEQQAVTSDIISNDPKPNRRRPKLMQSLSGGAQGTAPRTRGAGWRRRKAHEARPATILSGVVTCTKKRR